eukprot:15269640-Alexandrium_andersonii.AAC.1
MAKRTSQIRFYSRSWAFSADGVARLLVEAADLAGDGVGVDLHYPRKRPKALAGPADGGSPRSPIGHIATPLANC